MLIWKLISKKLCKLDYLAFVPYNPWDMERIGYMFAVERGYYVQ